MALTLMMGYLCSQSTTVLRRIFSPYGLGKKYWTASLTPPTPGWVIKFWMVSSDEIVGDGSSGSRELKTDRSLLSRSWPVFHRHDFWSVDDFLSLPQV